MAELIPAGWYIGTIVEHGFGPKDKEGTPYLAIQFELDNDPAELVSVGLITAYLYLSEAAIEYTAKTIRDAIGYKGNDPVALGEGKVLRGLKARVQVVHEVWKGKDRAKVGFINNINSTIGVAHGTLQKDKLKQLGTLLASLPANGTDDEIPL